MSGGSFNYLYCKENIDDLLYHTDDLDNMREALIKYGYEDIAKDTQRLIEYIKSAEVRVTVLAKKLQGVFKAVEYYESSDWGKDTMLKKLEEYRNGQNGMVYNSPAEISISEQTPAQLYRLGSGVNIIVDSCYIPVPIPYDSNELYVDISDNSIRAKIQFCDENKIFGIVMDIDQAEAILKGMEEFIKYFKGGNE